MRSPFGTKYINDINITSHKKSRIIYTFVCAFDSRYHRVQRSKGKYTNHQKELIAKSIIFWLANMNKSARH